MSCGLCCPWFSFPSWFLPGSMWNAQVAVHWKMSLWSFWLYSLYRSKWIFPLHISFSIGAFLFPFSPTKKSLFRANGGGVKAKWGQKKWLLQQQNKFGQASGAAVNCVSEAAGLGELPRALVCRGGRQLLGLRATAPPVQVPPYGAVFFLPPKVWAALECAGREQWRKGRFRAPDLWLNKSCLSAAYLLPICCLLSRHELLCVGVWRV